MKLIIFLFAISFFSFNTSTDLPIGADLPKADIKIKDISGKEITLKSAAKKNGLLVMFSCNTCPVVVKYQKRTKEICDYALKNNIGVVLLNSNAALRDSDDSFEAMKKYASQQDYKWFYSVDDNSVIADAFSATRTPEIFLFNKENKLIYKGAIDDNPSDASNVTRKHLKEAIDETVKGKDVSVKTSRSVGCTIKRL